MKNTIADTQYVIKNTLTRLFVFLYSLAIIAMNPIPTRIDNISSLTATSGNPAAYTAAQYASCSF